MKFENDSKIGHLDDFAHVYDATNLKEANTLLNTQIAAYHQMYIAEHYLNDTMTLISLRYLVTSTRFQGCFSGIIIYTNLILTGKFESMKRIRYENFAGC